MEEEAMAEALDAIHDEACRLLALGPTRTTDVEGGLQLIIALARYKHDIRSVHGIKKARKE